MYKTRLAFIKADNIETSSRNNKKSFKRVSSSVKNLIRKRKDEAKSRYLKRSNARDTKHLKFDSFCLSSNISNTYPQVSIKTQFEDVFTLDVQMSQTVRSLMQLIQNYSGIPMDKQRLKYKGLTLEEDKTLEYYNIQEESTIDLVIKDYKVLVDCLIPNLQCPTLYVEITDSIRSLMIMIQIHTGIPCELQELSYECDMIDNSSNLVDCNNCNKVQKIIYVDLSMISVKLNVVNHLDKRIVLRFELFKTIQDVKMRLSNYGYPVNSQCLYFNRLELQNHMTLLDYGIQSDATICLKLLPIFVKTDHIRVKTPNQFISDLAESIHKNMRKIPSDYVKSKTIEVSPHQTSSDNVMNNNAVNQDNQSDLPVALPKTNSNSYEFNITETSSRLNNHDQFIIGSLILIELVWYSILLWNLGFFNTLKEVLIQEIKPLLIDFLGFLLMVGFCCYSLKTISEIVDEIEENSRVQALGLSIILPIIWSTGIGLGPMIFITIVGLGLGVLVEKLLDNHKQSDE